MACGCGARRRAKAAGYKTVGYVVTYPDGTSSPENAPFLSIVEAKVEVRSAGGGTIRKVVRKT